ncbi:MAG: Na+/H+ antiporter subunit B [Chloroflexota bacterium]
MQSIILKTAVRYLMPLMLLFSVFVFLRGHNEPGGGFVGSLIAASAFVLYSIPYGPRAARELLQVDPRTLMGVGLLMVVVSGLISLFAGLPFLTGIWGEREYPVLHKLGTPLLFDTGVYLAVIGVTLLIIFELLNEWSERLPGQFEEEAN